MAGAHYRETTTAPAYDLVLAVCRCRIHYIGHVLHMSADRMVRYALINLVSDSIQYPTQLIQGLPGCRAATTSGNGVESCNVVRQCGVVIVNRPI